MTNRNQYPLITKRDIATRIEEDRDFLRECALLIEHRTEVREAKQAPVGKAWGWMSSDRMIAKHLIANLKANNLAESEKTKLRKLVARYSRQLAEHYRGRQLIEQPELAVAARKYGVTVFPRGENALTVSAGAQELQEQETVAPKVATEAVEDSASERSEETSSTAVVVEEPVPDRAEAVPAVPASPASESTDTAGLVLATLKAQPGLTCSELAQKLWIPTAVLSPILRELVVARHLRKSGMARATRYFIRS